MSWLTDVQSPKARELEKRKGWGYICGYCSNAFEGDSLQLDEHQNAGKHKMCKGVDDKFDKELYQKHRENGLTT